jgi:hypothetical protein
MSARKPAFTIGLGTRYASGRTTTEINVERIVTISMIETPKTAGAGKARTLNENACTMPLIDTVAVWQAAINKP